MTAATEAAFAVWKAFGSWDPERIQSAFTPDARCYAPPVNATSIASGCEAEELLTVDGMIRFSTGSYSRLFSEGATVEILNVVSEGEVAVFEQMFQAKVVSGRDYANRYCWAFRIQDGKVHEMREYTDTQAGFAMIFGDEPPRRLVD